MTKIPQRLQNLYIENPTVHAALQQVIHQNVDLHDALVNCIIVLAQQNEELMESLRECFTVGYRPVTMLASEDVLHRDWHNTNEDEIWKDL